MTHASSSDALLHVPDLPADLIDLANFPLPTSAIFRDAAHSADALEGTNYEDQKLAGFDGYPPYQACTDIMPTSHNINDLIDALHGRRLRQQREYEDDRLQLYKAAASNLDFLEQGVRALMMEFFKEWEEVGLALVGLAGCDREHDIKLGQHSRQWPARRCLDLYDDFQALRAGSDKFLVVYVDCWSR